MTNVEAIDPTTCSAWKSLLKVSQETSSTTIRDLLAEHPNRPAELSLEAAGIYADFSRQRVSKHALDLLYGLAEQTGVFSLRDAMFNGELINTTEGRAVLHTALRRPLGQSLDVAGVDVVGEVHEVLNRMGEFSDAVRTGAWTGATGKRITDVVNIGIGGSDLGPAMAYTALQDYRDRSITCHFVSNVDPSDIGEVLRGLNPESTLFIVASKTFSTLETMTNAGQGRSWLVSALGDAAVAQHFVAVSTNAQDVANFGIDVKNMFGFWDWVGGRYSMESAIGLSTMVAIGRENFQQLLHGFHSMDEHFATAPAGENLPLLMGLLSVWNRDFLQVPTTAVLPYSHYLSRFPAYLQQLTMESNGKSVRRDGSTVSYDTGGIYWGEPGTNGQHSFYQMLHQGTSTIACDVIVLAQSAHGHDDQQDMLVANALAQAAVLSLGRTAQEVIADGTKSELVAHKVMPGNRPTTVFMMQKLDPFTLGALVALYEHSVFVQGAVWGINSFDQWGVELGKKVALGILADLRANTSKDSQLDPASVADIDKYLSLK
jgi:glucose-6-phosphate isomerase